MFGFVSLKFHKAIKRCKLLRKSVLHFCIIKSACLLMSVLPMKITISPRKSDKYTLGKKYTKITVKIYIKVCHMESNYDEETIWFLITCYKSSLLS